MVRFSLLSLVVFLPLLVACGYFSMTFERQGEFVATIAVASSGEIPPPPTPKMEERTFDGKLLGWPLVGPSFEMIDNVRQVYETIRELQRDARHRT